MELTVTKQKASDKLSLQKKIFLGNLWKNCPIICHMMLLILTFYEGKSESFFCIFLQVLRNHELVGQIRLDELEARLDRITPEEDHTVPDTSAIIDRDDVPIGMQTETVAERKMDMEQLQNEDASQSQEDPQQAQCLKEKTAEAENLNSQTERKDIQIQENQAQQKPGNGDEDNVRKSDLKEKTARLVEGSPDKWPGLPLTKRMFNDAKIEEHILRCVVQLEKDDGAVTKRRKSELDLPSQQEMKMDAVLAHNHLLFTNTSIMNPAKLDGARNPSHFPFRRHSLTHRVHNAQRKFGSVGVPFPAYKDKQAENPGGSGGENSCGENVGVAEEERLVSGCKEEEDDQGVDEVTHRRKKPRCEDDGVMKRAESLGTSEGMHEYSGSKSVSGLDAAPFFKW